MTINAMEAFALLKTTKAVLVKTEGAFVPGTPMPYLADGECQLDIFFYREIEEEGIGEEPVYRQDLYSFAWEKDDELEIKGNTLLLTEAMTGEEIQVELLIPMVLKLKHKATQAA
jgi:hypothetical protein